MIEYPDRINNDNEPGPVIKSDDNIDDNEWEIECLLSKRKYRNKIQYLVKWKGYADHENTWLSVDQLVNAKQLIKDYEQSI